MLNLAKRIAFAIDASAKPRTCAGSFRALARNRHGPCRFSRFRRRIGDRRGSVHMRGAKTAR
jgi:hypothetical protein